MTVRRCDLSPIGHGSRRGFKNGTTRLAAFSIKPSSVCKALNSSGKKKVLNHPILRSIMLMAKTSLDGQMAKLGTPICYHALMVKCR